MDWDFSDKTTILKPGRELDALIATKVMNDDLWLCRGTQVDRGGGWGCSDCFYSGEWLEEDPFKEHLKEVKYYSTDISAAWEIVDKLLEKDLRLTITHAEKNLWFVFIVKGFNTPLNKDAIEAETAAHAICLAALKALS